MSEADKPRKFIKIRFRKYEVAFEVNSIMTFGKDGSAISTMNLELLFYLDSITYKTGMGFKSINMKQAIEYEVFEQ